MNNLAKRLIEENLRTKNPVLDLGNCGLDGTEPLLERLEECNHLETLILGNSWFEDVSQISTFEFTQNTDNDDYPNNLRQLPLLLPKNLKRLVAGCIVEKWGIQDLSPLQNLTSLQQLYLANNNITNLAPLGHLANLQVLDVSFNNVVNITPLAPLKQLKKFTAVDCAINDLTPLQHLNKLEKLALNTNKITDLAPLAQLANLKAIDLSDNLITGIHPLENLVNIRQLNLSNNTIADITPLENLALLNRLYLDHNNIVYLPLFHRFQNLTLLDLNFNKIREFPHDFLKPLIGLHILYLHNNPIENIPSSITGGKNKADFIARWFAKQEGNVLPKLRNYLQSIENKADRRPLHEAKLIFVGVGDVGKTELAEAISNPAYSFEQRRTTTQGICIKQWQPPNCELDDEVIDFTANIWDFAGQEINYGTHQFFLTKNSVYVFVWETRKGEQTEAFNYWLRIVSLLSDNAPIIVVQNKVDVYESEIDQKNWKKRFHNIVGFLKTSCKTGQGIDILRETVIDELLALPHIREVWNKHRFAVRKTLEQYNVDCISKREYLKICAEHQVNRTDAGFLSNQLHDIGAILHFGNEAKLKNTVVLKPQWATEAAYLLRDSKHVVQGRFSLHDLDHIWPEERFDDKHMFLLHLMEQFELIFQLQDDIKYIIPELLPIEMPSRVIYLQPTTNEARHLHFEYHYEFMPKGVLSRFICRIHRLIHEELFWKYGVVLAYEQSYAKVLWDDTDIRKTIAIEVWGPEADKLLFLIRNHLEHIHEKLNYPPLQEKVPCVCPVGCPHKTKPHLHDYQTLRKFQAKGKSKRVCDKSVEDVSIQSMLEGILDNKEDHTRRLFYLINTNNVAGFFDLLDQMGIQQSQLSALKDEFVHGNTSFQFAERLIVWVQTHFRGRGW
ncbi:COR domain-containing protein [uncultured Microscilla sp.]|uniref:COR domain-containing protein n=1 Tax=uncultured Microscilla sp. TaxID=432653 RepID=UPI002633FD41|nr:COR domain-containing protein [uncultured Microscilla sp.]